MRGLSADEVGSRFLINLADCLLDGAIPARLAKDILNEIVARGETPPMSSDRILSLLGDIIFENPDAYQFIGPAPKAATAEWITVKSLGDIVLCMKPSSGLSPEELRQQLGLASLRGPHTGLEDEKGEEIAELLNAEANGYRFALAKDFPIDGRSRFAPSWYSKWGFIPGPRRWDFTPSTVFAGRLRDWLGLCQYGADHLLFVFKARQPFDVAELSAHRPTLLDGFDNKLYKHRCSAELRAAVTGSTIDIEKVRTGRIGLVGDLEGGPELVSRGLWFSAKQFTCEYVGRTPPLEMNPDREPAHTLMLADGFSLEMAIDAIVVAIDNERGTDP